MERVKKIKDAIRGKDSYRPYMDHIVMKEYSLTHQDLMESSYEWYLEASKILTLETKEEKKEQQEAESEMEGNL